MRRRRSFSSSVSSIYSDATLALDFENSFYKKDSFTTSNFNLLPSLSVTRAGGGYAEDTLGNLTWFSSNTARVTNRGLLIEEARTNIALWSQSIVGHYAAGTPAVGQWGGFSGSISLPGGTVNGPAPSSLMEQVSFGAATQINIGQRTVVSSSTTYTASVWLATSSGTYDLKLSQTNTVSWASATTSPVITVSTTPKRYSITFTTGAGDTLADILIGGESKTPYNLPVTGSVYVWGLQLEAGPSATSYIPTTSSSVTRPRDDVWITNLPAPPECTFLYEYEKPNVVGDNRGVATLWDGTSSNRFRTSEFSAGFVEVASSSGGVGPAVTISQQGSANRRLAFRNRYNDLRVYLNGIQGGQNTGSLTVPSTANTLTIGTNLIEASPGLNSYFKKIVMYSRAYSDSELYVLTTGIDTSSFSLDFANGIYKNTSGYVRTNYVTRTNDPTYWPLSGGANGITWNRVSTGIENGLPYADYRITGTASITTTSVDIGLGLVSRTAAANGETWTASAYAKLIAGSGAGLTALGARIVVVEETGTNVYYGLTDGNTALSDGSLNRLVASRTMSAGTTTSARMTFLENITLGIPVDRTWRLYAPQFEKTSYPTTFINTGAAPSSTTTYSSYNPADIGNMSFARASMGYAEDLQGNLIQFATNVPRITNKGLLIEETRTNLVLQSQAFDNAVWTKFGGAITAAYGVDPAGTNTASRAARASGPAGGAVFEQVVAGAGASQTHTLSLWVKSNTGVNQTFALKLTQQGVADNFSADLTATTTWQRFVFSRTFTTGGTGSAIVGIALASTGAAADLQVWGAQLETASFASSYIPTTASSVTRAADQLYYNSTAIPLQNAMSFIANSGPVANTNSARWFFATGADSSNNRIGLAANQTPNTLVGRYVTGGAGKSPGDIIGGVSINDNNIVGLSYAVGSSVKMAGNATLSGSPGGDPTSLPSQGILAIGSAVDLTGPHNGFIKKFSAYNYGMSDAELTHRTRIIAAYNLLLESNSYLLQEDNGLTKLEGYFA